jgi:hypothetical protein
MEELNKSEADKPIDNYTATQRAIHRLYDGLEHKEKFTVEEAASLTLRSPIAIRQAVRRGELKGVIINHRVNCIPRQSLLEWLQTRPKN